MTDKFDFASKKEKDFLESVWGNTAIEVGSFMGHTTVKLAKNFDKVFAIDPFTATAEQEQNGKCNAYKEFKKRTTRFKNIRLIKKTSHRAFLENKFPEYGADFIFIDAAHDFKNAYRDIKMWTNHLSVGGVIAIHDCRRFHKNKGNFEVYKAVNRLIYWGNFHNIKFIDTIVAAEYGYWGFTNIFKFIWRWFDDWRHYLLYEVGLYWLIFNKKG